MQQDARSPLNALLKRMGPSEQELLANKSLYLAIRSKTLGPKDAQYVTLVNLKQQYELQPLPSMVQGNQVELVLVAASTPTAPVLLDTPSDSGIMFVALVTHHSGAPGPFISG